MSNYTNDTLAAYMRRLLTAERGSQVFEDFDNWLYYHYPHVRVQEIGDTPMFWFSESRCNPPLPEDRLLVSAQVNRLNWVMMRAKRSLYSKFPLGFWLKS